MTETTAAESSSLETREEATAVGGEAKFWQGQIALSESDHKDWIDEGKGVVKRYKGEQRAVAKGGAKRFNILYSNTETLKAALFGRMAKPDVRRRFADRDPVGRQVSEIVERSAIYCDDSYDAEREFEQAIEDYLLPGRGVVRVVYEAETAQGEDKKDYVANQVLYDKYWPWDDFRHEPGKVWTDVTWIAYRHRMSRKLLRDNFQKGKDPRATLSKEDVDAIPLNWTPKAEDDKLPDAYKRAEVWEIWDKETTSRVWIVNGYQKVLRKDDDPYGLENFFDTAEPLRALTANDTFIPRPEFETYRDQADGLDEIEARIDRLTRALKRRGVYDATIAELKRLAKAADNEFIPVKNYADLTTKGGLAAAFQSEDLSVIATVLSELHAQRDLRIQTIYEVVGIADIMRGATDPRETLGAQKIKAQFGGNRLKKRQDKVQKWIRNILRLKAEIIAEHFEPQKLAEMTGFKWQPIPPQMPAPPTMPLGNGAIPTMPAAPGTQANILGSMPPMPQPTAPSAPPSVDGLITPEMIAILRNDKLRSYRIDIETDSTVFEDAEAEKQARTELLKSISEFVVAWMPVIQGQPKMLPLAFEMLAFGVRGFKAGRQLEEAIEQAKMQLEEAAKQPPPPTPEDKKLQADQQLNASKMQMEQQKQAGEMQVKQAELAMKEREMAVKLEFDRQKHEQEMAFEAQKHQAEMAMRQEEMRMKQVEGEIDRQQQAEQHAQTMAADGQKAQMEMDFRRQEASDTRKLKREEMGMKERETETGETEGVSAEDVRSERTNAVMKEMAEAIKGLGAGFEQLSKASMAKRRVVRGADGRASHVELMQ